MKAPRLPPVDPKQASLEIASAERYTRRAVLGRGGMGEVRLCRDLRIGRDIALKVMLEPGGDPVAARARFLHEARVQGQLEHPAIPPVYDMGLGDDGVFFTMKCLRGRTLETLLDAMRRGDPEVLAELSPVRLLSAFTAACQAVDYAHQRGVLHRDLKPGNLMLGFHGEVYVLDWGIAQVGAPAPDVGGGVGRDRTSSLQTSAGELLGTVGYMAPEQIDRQTELSPATDVYALGAILFELLTLQPLHERTNVHQIVFRTTEGKVDARPSVRAPEREIAPELEAICVKATAREPGARFATAAEMVDALQRYLDGQRDEARRQQLAAEHGARAARLAERAFAGDDEQARKDALAAAGRALALHPDDRTARQVLVRLLTEPPRVLPAAVAEELAASARAQRRATARLSVWGAGVVTVVCLVSMLAMGVRDYRVVAWLATGVSAAAALLWLNARRAQPTTLLTGLEVAFRVGAVAAFGRLFGPLVLMPGLFSLAAITYGSASDERRARIGVGGTVIGFLVAVALDVGGVLSPSYRFDGAVITMLPNAVDLRAVPSLFVLTLFSLVLVVAPFVAMRRLHRATATAERDRALRGWQLGQLLPDAGG